MINFMSDAYGVCAVFDGGAKFSGFGKAHDEKYATQNRRRAFHVKILTDGGTIERLNVALMKLDRLPILAHIVVRPAKVIIELDLKGKITQGLRKTQASSTCLGGFFPITHERVVVDHVARDSSKTALITEGFRKGFGC